MNNTPVPTEFFGTNIFDILGNIGQNFPILLGKFGMFLESDNILYLKFFLIAVSIVLIFFIVVVLLKLTAMIRHLNSMYHPHHGHGDDSHGGGHGDSHAHEAHSKVKPKAMKEAWESVARHMASTNISDWKLAILEADSILDELTKELKLPGESLGERLMVATEHEIKMLQFAWDAHKARNRIAHEGIRAVLSREDAIRILGAYERVFREFDYI